MDWDKINLAITDYLSISWMEETTITITEEFGKEVMSTINKIKADIGNDYMVSHDDYSLKENLVKLNIEYPQLTNASLIKLLDFATFFWWKSDEFPR